MIYWAGIIVGLIVLGLVWEHGYHLGARDYASTVRPTAAKNIP